MLESEARDDTIIEKLDADYEDVESLKKMILILCDVENMLKIAHYKMYLKYLTDSRNIKKIAELKKKV